MKIASLVAVLPVLALLAGCAGNGAEEDNNAEGAALSTTGDLLATCSALETADVGAVTIGDENARIKQEYSLYDGTKVTNAVAASTTYDVRFYRDSAGKTKFQLTIGTFSGMQSSIEGSSKGFSVSGNVTFNDGYGQLTITSRRDAFKAIAGDISSFRIDGLDCNADAPSMNIEVPVIVLEKSTEKLVPLTTTPGESSQVTPTFHFAKKADKVTMRFTHAQG